MGREENGFAFVLETLNDFPNFHAAERVKTAGWFVENEQIGIIDQRLRQTNALLHPFGIGLDEALSGVLQIHQFQNGIHDAVRSSLRGILKIVA